MIEEIEQFRNMPFEKGLIHHSGREKIVVSALAQVLRLVLILRRRDD